MAPPLKSRTAEIVLAIADREKQFLSVFDGFQPFKHQQAFIEDRENRNICLCSGYGGGKTKALLYKLIDLSHCNAGFSGGLYAPTAELARDVLIPELDDILEEIGLRFDYWSSPNPRYELHFKEGSTTVLVRSMENWKRIVGNNFAFACIDEIDTIRADVAEIAWKKIMGRMRAGNVRQIATTSTPEGFKFLYKWFVKQPKEAEALGKPIKGRRLIQAKTTDNPTLPEDFVQDLLDNYDPQLIEAYMNGQFVNLTSGTVYSNFDRELNHSNEAVKDKEPLHIGMDFNVRNMAAVVNVIRDGLPVAVAELVKLEDTPAMVRAIKGRFPGHEIVIYPDASGGNTSSKNASESDLTLLKQAGFKVKVNSRNPSVKDRVATVQAAFLNAQGERRYKVNTTKCPTLTESLEQQVWTESGDPDKTQGLDHTCFSGDTKIITPNGLVPIESAPAQGLVYTIDGSIAAYHSCKKIMTLAPIVRVVFSSGRIVECTPSHEFLTPSGWVPASQLIGNSVCIQSMSKQDFALDRVLDVVSAGNKDVYCLTVPTHGCFLIEGGYVVSNCDAMGYAIMALMPIKIKEIRQSRYVQVY